MKEFKYAHSKFLILCENIHTWIRQEFIPKSDFYRDIYIYLLVFIL